MVRVNPDGDERSVNYTRFKLHLRPKTLASSHIRDDDLPELPPNKSAEQILGDFINYLYTSTKTYIKETHPGGPAFWQSIENNVEYVLSLPNGWEGQQQAQMRRAAIKAGLVANEAQAQDRISFVTEGEASLHYCIQKGITKEAVKVRHSLCCFLYGYALTCMTCTARGRSYYSRLWRWHD